MKTLDEELVSIDGLVGVPREDDKVRPEETRTDLEVLITDTRFEELVNLWEVAVESLVRVFKD